MQGDGGDHRIGDADRLTAALQLSGDASGQLGGGLVECDNLLPGDGGQEGLKALRTVRRWKPRTISMTPIAESV
jgi:hypothetical protein